MRHIHFLMVFAVVVAMGFTTASANGEGAIVDRSQDTGFFIIYHWDGGSTLTLTSASPDFYCGPAGTTVFWDAQRVILPFDTLHYRDKGSYFLRAYNATPDDLFATPDPWDFICTAAPVAEGIVSMTYRHKGFNVVTQEWETANGVILDGHHFSGPIQDLAGLCDGDTVTISTTRRWKVVPNSGCPDVLDCYFEQVAHGPTLDCED